VRFLRGTNGTETKYSSLRKQEKKKLGVEASSLVDLGPGKEFSPERLVIFLDEIGKKMQNGGGGGGVRVVCWGGGGGWLRVVPEPGGTAV